MLRARRAFAGNIWLTLILIAGLLLRLWLWWRVPVHATANDEYEYLQVARDLAAGRGWVFYESYDWLRAPLYQLFLAGSLLLTHGSLRWAALPNVVLSAGTVYLFYLLGRALARGDAGTAPEEPRVERAGLIAAGLSAALLPFATFASLWMSETLFTALFAGACIVLLHWAARPALRSAALAGVLVGLATLTKSPPLATLPLLAVWMIWQRPRHASVRPYVAGAAVCLLLALGTIAPWTIRNWIAYDAFIPVDTTLSYNLWFHSEPREDPDMIARTLRSIPNPAERAGFASRKGLERLREDPGIIARKIRRNWFYLWHIKPIEDRFRQESPYEDVPLGMFVLGLGLDDGLYLLILAGTIAGFVLVPRSRAKILLGGWTLYIIAVVVLLQGEARYRQLLYPAFIPIAAGLFAGQWWALRSRPWRVVALGLGLIGLLPLRDYPYSWAATNVRRGVVELTGDWAMARGDYIGAEAAYKRAAEIDPNSTGVLLKLGLAYERHNQLGQAVEAYRWARAVAPLYVATSVRLGDALRRMGARDAARQAFAGFYSDPKEISDWAWRNLRAPAPAMIAVGDRLDVGFVGGMYAPEELGDGRRVRWTTASGAIRLAGGAHGTLVRLTLAAPRPDNVPVKAQICVAEWCQNIEVDGQWRNYTLFVPSSCQRDAPGAGARCETMLEVALRSPTFVPTGSTQKRQLGLLVDHAAAVPLPAERPAASDSQRRKTP